VLVTMTALAVLTALDRIRTVLHASVAAKDIRYITLAVNDVACDVTP